MGQYNDDLKESLIALGYEGAINDMLVEMYRANGYEGTLNDMAKEVRDSLGVTTMFPIIP